jgi:bla regulator protein BlaR1
MAHGAIKVLVSRTILPLLAIFILVKPIAPQAPSEHHDSQGQPKELAFAAVSIHRNKSRGPQQFGAATADGYRMKNMFLAAPIVTAYVPSAGGASSYADDQIVGMPSWLTSDEEQYDIDAKVDEADLPNWQNPATRQTMLRSMLQSMLADRLKLVVHRATMTGPVYRLVMGKSGGPKFKESDPNDPHPGSYPFPGGGQLSMELHGDQMTTHYFGISIGQLAAMWSGQEGRPVIDATGLTGKYDLTIRKTIQARPATAEPMVAPGPGSQESTTSLAEQLGLRLEAGKGEIETLVIDHVEHPSEN